MAQATVGPVPGEQPVDHAEQQHGQRLAQARFGLAGLPGADGFGKTGHHPALGAQHTRAVVGLEEAHVLGQHAVRVLGIGILVDDAFDQVAHRIGRRPLLRTDLVDQRFQRGDMADRDLYQQRVLVAVVVVERGLRQTGGLGHLVHRGADVATLGEQPRRVAQDGLALFVVVGSAAAGHGFTK